MRTTSGIDAASFRDVLGHFPTGVVVVTTLFDGAPGGLAINSFTSVSLDPPLVAFFPAHTSGSWPAIRRAGTFCVNILAAGQEPLARLFATKDAERFGPGVAWRPSPIGGDPLLDGVLGWLDCAIEGVTPAGDHDFVLGRVLALGAGSADTTEPLIFHRGRYLPSSPLR